MSEEPAKLGEYNGFEIYPMPVFVTLVVDDAPGVVDWYVRALGFGVMFRGPVVHLRRSKYQDILIAQTPPQRAATTGGPAITFAADDVDALAERARAVAPTGRAAIEGPIDTPWNTRDLNVTDPAGHRLVFTSRRANPDPEDVARWKRMFDAAREA
jgi:uncharacterized glyoxalase superfamily protein PhnB